MRLLDIEIAYFCPGVVVGAALCGFITPYTSGQWRRAHVAPPLAVC